VKTNRKLFPDHLPFILHGVLVGAGSLWPLVITSHGPPLSSLKMPLSSGATRTLKGEGDMALPLF